jgi:hypothetical protein
VSQLSRCTEVFVVRVWAEYRGRIPPIWRGEIEHTRSKRVAHFNNIDEMIGFIKQCTEYKPIQE